ncbi:MAG TPA: ESX secretion-associated protein EspG [Pseudonocardiaceae bacterium]
MSTSELARPAQFGLVELDLLATYAGAELPFPLQVPSFGRVPDERDLLFAGAGATLRVRGLADDDGPAGLADQLVALLARRTGTVDLVLGGPGWESGAVALVDRSTAVLCLQRFNPEEHHLVDAHQVDGDTLAAELMALVPELAGGHSIPLRLPLHAVRSAHEILVRAQRAGTDPDRRDVEQRVYEELRAGGVDPTAAGKLATVLHPLEGYGQLGVTRPGDGGEDVRVGHELSWIDTPGGRYRVGSSAGGRDHDGWVSINPLHPDELYTLVRGFVSTVRR